MNTKYTSKPNFNPNEPKIFGFVSVILTKARIQSFSCRQKNENEDSCKSCLSCLRISLSLISGLLSLVCSTKQTQFFYDQMCIINIKNAEMEVKKQPKKKKQTQLWKT